MQHTIPSIPDPDPTKPDARQAELRNFDGLEQDLEALVKLAADIAGTPIAFVSLFDGQKQKVLAQQGPGIGSHLPADCSFWSSPAVHSNQSVVINTAPGQRVSFNLQTKDARATCACVGSTMSVSRGNLPGLFCVADIKPRQYSPDVLEQIETLASVASYLSEHCTRYPGLSESPEIGGTDPILDLRGFRSVVANWLEENDDAGTLILVDADQFKLINDRFGHTFGDKYLAAIQATLCRCMPEGTILAHTGGDEFAAFVPELADGDRDLMLLTLRTLLRARAAGLDKPDLGKLSIGTVSTLSVEGRGFEDLYQAADVALLASRDRGMNRTTHFDPGIDETYNIGKLQSRFLDALDAAEVIPYFQPVLDLATGEVASFEALVRWNDPDRGLLTPAAFTKMLTDRSAGPLLTQKMIDGALHAHHLLRGKGLPAVRLAVNLTERDLADPGFVPNLDWKISESGFEWNDFTFEVTETVMLGNVEERIFKSMSALRARGAKIALDDFGTGYAGLVHLRDWPITSLKIDQKFVKNLATSEKDHIIVQMILDLATRLDLQVCAEGIEDAHAARILAGFGCDFGQGYHYSQPLELSAALSFLEDSVRQSQTANAALV